MVTAAAPAFWRASATCTSHNHERQLLSYLAAIKTGCKSFSRHTKADLALQLLNWCSEATPRQTDCKEPPWRCAACSHLHDINFGIGLSGPNFDSEGDGNAFSYPSHKPAKLGGLAQQGSSQAPSCCFCTPHHAAVQSQCQHSAILGIGS